MSSIPGRVQAVDETKGAFCCVGGLTYPKASLLEEVLQLCIFLETQDAAGADMSLILRSFFVKCYTLTSVKALENQGTITCQVYPN